MFLWELSLRHPEDIKGVRIPNPFPALTAACHISTVINCVSSSTTGMGLLIVSPYGLVSLTDVYHIARYYTGAYNDGVAGSNNYSKIVPFSDASTPVNGFCFRPVSMSVKVFPTTTIDNMQGAITVGVYPL